MHIRSHVRLKFFIALSVLFALLFVMLGTTASAFSISDCEKLSRNQKIGMSGADVLVLQLLLNKNMVTKIAIDGAGSPGNETLYFGTKTKIAVIKFQELYKNDVLTPVGLVSGNGFVGSYSRTKLHGLCIAALARTKLPVNITPTSTPTIASEPTTNATTSMQIPVSDISGSTSSSSMSGKTPYIIYPSSYSLHQGAKMSIYGGGFTETNNTVTLGTLTWTGLSPSTMGTLDVTIPQDGAKGKFDLWFTNAKGQSNKSFVVITEINSVDPQVTSFTPTSGPTYTSITLTGKGFSKDWNEIYLSSKIIKGITSTDGTTLTFKAEIDVPGVSPGQDVAGVDVSTPLWFYVINPNGVSNSQVFTLKF